jgi:LPS-assembly protein
MGPTLRQVTKLVAVVVVALAVSIGAETVSAQSPPVSLLADQIRYDTESGELLAEGNVEIYFEGRVLKAARIVYDEASGRIRAEGPLILTDLEGSILVAEDAELSSDLSEGLITGARLLLEGKLQFASNELIRTGGRYNALYATVASSCRVCGDDTPPTWQIRASRVVQDEVERRIYFENARLEVLGLPIAWLPWLRIPDPAVQRASGFLVPEFVRSQIFGSGIKLPYYHVSGPYGDATLTPFLTSNGGALLEGEYRRRLASGGFDLQGVFAFDDGLGNTSGRGTLTATGGFEIGRGFTSDFDINVASDKDFLRQFDYSDTDQLTSEAAIRRTRDKDQFSLSLVGFQTLREDEDSDTVPFILPDLHYRRVFEEPLGGGRFGLDLNALGVLREEGGDMVRMGGGADWTRSTVFDSGLLVTAGAEAGLDLYLARDEPTVDSDSFQARVSPGAHLELRMPFARGTGRSTHVIEPIAQLVYTTTLGDEDVPNEDSLLPNFDDTNLFALNRFPGQDRIETGLRANLGVSYNWFDPSGWNLGAMVGRVFRAEETDQFSPSLGLGGRTSDYVTAVTLDFRDSIRFLGRSVFDDRLRFKQSEFAFDYSTTLGSVAAIYTYRREDDQLGFGVQPETNEFAIDADYRIAANWGIRGNWRYDLATDNNIRAGGGITYGNECAVLDLSVSRRFTSSDNVPPATSIGFSVRLAGLGSDSGEWPARQCGG